MMDSKLWLSGQERNTRWDFLPAQTSFKVNVPTVLMTPTVNEEMTQSERRVRTWIRSDREGRPDWWSNNSAELGNIPPQLRDWNKTTNTIFGTEVDVNLRIINRIQIQCYQFKFKWPSMIPIIYLRPARYMIFLELLYCYKWKKSVRYTNIHKISSFIWILKILT